MGESLDKAKTRVNGLKDREILELILAEIYNIKSSLNVIWDKFESLEEESDNETEDREDDENEDDEGDRRTEIRREIKKHEEKSEKERKLKEFRDKHGSDVVALKRR